MPRYAFEKDAPYSAFLIDHMDLDRRSLRFHPQHHHNRGEFLLVEEGVSTLVADGNVFHGKGRYLIYTPPGCVHEQFNDHKDRYKRYCFYFTPAYIDWEAYSLPDTPFLLDLNDHENYTPLYLLVSTMYQLYTEQSEHLSGVRLKYLLLLVLNELQPLLANVSISISEGNPVITGARERYIRDVCQYIKQHIGEALSIDHLAEIFFVSRSKLTRDFRYVIHLSIVDYISRTKIHKSISYLLGEYSLSEVASRSGFSSVSYYIRCFKKWSGTTPWKYRAQHLGEDFDGEE